MISKILSEYERKEEEKILDEKNKEIWFYKVNDDNIHPVFKPFNFAENEKLEEKKRREDKENTEITIIQIGKKQIKFGKNSQKTYMEYLYKSTNERRAAQPREVKKLPQKAILKNYIRNKRYEDNQGIFENIDKIEAEGDFTLFNIVDLIDFDISKKDKVKDFESNFKKFSFIINPVFLEILKSKKEKINSKKINSLLTFLKEEIETSFNNPPKLRIYKIKELFDCFDEENFDEDKLCEKIINIYTLEGKLSFYVFTSCYFYTLSIRRKKTRQIVRFLK